ncbi:tetA [Symbiodinium natans]|uniref:TetA protein n=1 Tax=Symbiodinium natans TaxID=878477 RepID=A0A812IE59_9DINO|nr:tetA [Symbiodinium natans]
MQDCKNSDTCRFSVVEVMCRVVFFNTFQFPVIVKDSGVDKILGDVALQGYLNYKASLAAAFRKILCDPEDACNIRPSHVTNLLSNMTVKDIKHFKGPCHKGVALEA